MRLLFSFLWLVASACVTVPTRPVSAQAVDRAEPDGGLPTFVALPPCRLIETSGRPCQPQVWLDGANEAARQRDLRQRPLWNFEPRRFDGGD